MKQDYNIYNWHSNKNTDGLVNRLASNLIILNQAHKVAWLIGELASRADQRILKWFGHVERMDDYRMARRVLMAEVSGGRVQGRPRLGWLDGM